MEEGLSMSKQSNRWITCFTAALLLIAVFSFTARAETKTLDLEAWGIDIYGKGLVNGQDMDCTIIADQPGDIEGDVMIDPSGEVIGDVYSYMSYDVGADVIKVEDTSVDRVHNKGVIDNRGNILVPVQYASIDVIDRNWQIGLKMIPCEADEKDYTLTVYGRDGNTNEFYKIDTADVYYKGQLAGTLSRSEYGTGYTTAYGAYILIPNRQDEKIYYNSKLERAPYNKDYYGEFSDDYDTKQTIHNGSGEAAFVPEFDIPMEDLKNPYRYDKMTLYDVYGNTVFVAAQNYDYISAFNGGYATVRMNGLEGMVNLAGEEIVPVQYDDVGNSESDPFAYGCISVIKDGKFGFIDRNGNVTCDFVYSKDIVENHGSFGVVKNLDGSRIVLSGLIGELPEHYASVSFPAYYNSRVFIAENDAGELALIDLYGDELIPFGRYKFIEATADGSIAAVAHDRKNYGDWTLYQFDVPIVPQNEMKFVTEETETEDYLAAPVTDQSGVIILTGTAQPENAETEEINPGAVIEEPLPEKETQPETWTCSNGHEGNTRNFCAECGEARPAPAPTECSNCGYVFEEGKVPKFCPECGTKVEQ